MKPLMTRNQLETKLKRIEKTHRTKLLKFARDAQASADNETDAHNWSFRYLKRAENALADALSLRFKKRACYFENSSGSCGFDPLSGEGHSYRWYALSRVIKGTLVLNTYNYSNQTAKHISKLRTLLKLLNLKFIELEAPRGLQNLETARDHIAREFGRVTIRRKYARIPNPFELQHITQMMSNARKLGLTFPQTLLKQAITSAETERREHLDRLKTRREKRKAAQRITDNSNAHSRLNLTA